MVAMTDTTASLPAKLNWLRAGVLGANDGIVSTAGIVMGVAGATNDSTALLVAGLAGLVAGALSMAGGEYVSVSSQKDTELAVVASVRETLADQPEQALADLAATYQAQGMAPDLAAQVARALTRHDAVGAQTQARFGISAHEQTSPWAAALASFLAFTVGALIPLLVMVTTPAPVRVVATIVAVVVALALTGSVSAWLGHAKIARAVLRNCLVGALTMAITFLVGHVVGVQL
jgi:VIT1/CCC1 family predicted Fe2+/Mn2+ transporter